VVFTSRRQVCLYYPHKQVMPEKRRFLIDFDRKAGIYLPDT
jgi:hypothetical protein